MEQQATSHNRGAAKKSRKSGEGGNWCHECPKNKKSKKTHWKKPEGETVTLVPERSRAQVVPAEIHLVKRQVTVVKRWAALPDILPHRQTKRGGDPAFFPSSCLMKSIFFSVLPFLKERKVCDTLVCFLPGARWRFFKVKGQGWVRVGRGVVVQSRMRRGWLSVAFYQGTRFMVCILGLSNVLEPEDYPTCKEGPFCSAWLRPPSHYLVCSLRVGF